VPANQAQVVDFLLVGGGLASATAAETLRAAGAEGSIGTRNYQRPSLARWVDCIVGHGQLRARLKYRRRGGRRNVTGNETKETCVAKEQTTERSLAKPGRLLQHGLEHRLQFARRT